VFMHERPMASNIRTDYFGDEVSVKSSARASQALFGSTIFLSAFLLFWVQLLLGKYILPWFGGAAAVWTTCMLFFQVLLLAGYTYSHWLSRLKSRAQASFHTALLLSSILLLGSLGLVWNSPITPGTNWKPHGADHPVFQIVTLLGISVGLPFFCAVLNGPTYSVMVLAKEWKWFSLSSLFSLQLGLLPLTSGISGAAGTNPDFEIPGLALVFGVFGLRDHLYFRRLESSRER